LSLINCIGGDESVREILPLLISGFTIAVAYTVLPGPVNTEATRRGLSHGFRPAMTIQMGSLVGDLLWAILGLTGAVVVLQRESLAMMLGLVGAGFMFSLARTAFRAAIRKADPTSTSPTGNGWKVGIMFSLANPAGIAFWSGVGGGMLGATATVSITEVTAILGSYIVGSAVCGTILAALAGLGRRYANGPMMRWIDGACGVALTWFGVRLLWSTAQRAVRWLSPFRSAFV
jgi:threonine/homoserine/homoserine lactone efflux protein